MRYLHEIRINIVCLIPSHPTTVAPECVGNFGGPMSRWHKENITAGREEPREKPKYDLSTPPTHQDAAGFNDHGGRDQPNVTVLGLQEHKRLLMVLIAVVRICN
jgi:hypothetical protein